MANLILRTPADLLAAVPYLLGFHPTDSLVAVGLRRCRVVFQARADLPGPRLPVTDFAAHVAGVVAQQRVDTALLVGYGAAERVTPAVEATRSALALLDVEVPEMLRAEHGRYWSYVCDRPDCCPPDGVPYDIAASAVAAEATLAGWVALPDRHALVAQLAPVDGAARAAMSVATRRAGRRLERLLDPGAHRAATDGTASATARSRPNRRRLAKVLAAGEDAVATGLDRYRDGGRLDDDEAAWLTVLLTHRPVRDHAWSLIGSATAVTHRALWLDVVRRAQPHLVAAPATLLAFAAWQGGDGALASVALERALGVDPDYRLARLLDEALRHGLPPDVLTGSRPAGQPAQVIRSGRV
ncbi:MAG TPA: DUF4192 domain-containing protein [Micromonosporaceae bacterium]